MFYRLLLLLSGLNFLTGSLIAQENKQEPTYSKIYVFRDIYGSARIRIADYNSYNIGNKSVLCYKIYSKGKVQITSISSAKSQITNQIILKVEPDTNYYMLLDNSGGLGYSPNLQKVKKSQVQENIEEAKSKNKLLKFEEDLDNPINPESIKGQETLKQGSGFLISRKGFLLTNYHVIKNADKIFIEGINQKDSLRVKARKVTIDRANDLALLKVDSNFTDIKDIPYSLIKNSQAVKQGEKVFTLGYPMESVMGSGVKVAEGIINALSGYQGSISEYQFSASVQPGNSGGPLFNEAGQVIGIVRSKIQEEQVESVSYAIKANQVRLFLEQAPQIEYQLEQANYKNKSLPQKVEAFSDFVFIVKTK